ncbi:MAG: CinA family protein [Candidatus Omnitrophota bacterium]|nr:CinA family protein [Candidatus Omnitrophota bacterium]
MRKKITKTENKQTLEARIAELLTTSKKTISVAESCTGGLVANQLTNIPGSSKYFKVGIVAYSNQIKVNLLNVPLKIIEKNGAVSVKTALAMAKAIRKLSRTDIGLGITGIAGPGGATRKKPLGLVFIALATTNQAIWQEFNFTGNRTTIKSKVSRAALEMVRKYLCALS